MEANKLTDVLGNLADLKASIVRCTELTPADKSKLIKDALDMEVKLYNSLVNASEFTEALSKAKKPGRDMFDYR
jgi:hypothetical protein